MSGLHVVRFCPGAKPPGLGDYVASALSAVGITKDLAQAAAAAVGISDCGCGKRQAAANALGHKYLGLPAGSTAPPSDIEPAP